MCIRGKGREDGKSSGNRTTVVFEVGDEHGEGVRVHVFSTWWKTERGAGIWVLTPRRRGRLTVALLVRFLLFYPYLFTTPGYTLPITFSLRKSRCSFEGLRGEETIYIYICFPRHGRRPTPFIPSVSLHFFLYVCVCFTPYYGSQSGDSLKISRQKSPVGIRSDKLQVEQTCSWKISLLVFRVGRGDQQGFRGEKNVLVLSIIFVGRSRLSGTLPVTSAGDQLLPRLFLKIHAGTQ